MLANVKIEQDKENKNIHRVFIDGKQIEKITHLDFQVNPLEFPTVTLNIEQMSGVDFEGQAEVNFLKDPFTVKNACKILRDELMKNVELYNGFVSSIQTAIEEAPNYIKNRELAERILKRIVGEEIDERKD